MQRIDLIVYGGSFLISLILRMFFYTRTIYSSSFKSIVTVALTIVGGIAGGFWICVVTNVSTFYGIIIWCMISGITINLIGIGVPAIFKHICKKIYLNRYLKADLNSFKKYKREHSE